MQEFSNYILVKENNQLTTLLEKKNGGVSNPDSDSNLKLNI